MAIISPVTSKQSVFVRLENLEMRYLELQQSCRHILTNFDEIERFIANLSYQIDKISLKCDSLSDISAEYVSALNDIKNKNKNEPTNNDIDNSDTDSIDFDLLSTRIDAIRMKGTVSDTIRKKKSKSVTNTVKSSKSISHLKMNNNNKKKTKTNDVADDTVLYIRFECSRIARQKIYNFLVDYKDSVVKLFNKRNFALVYFKKSSVCKMVCAMYNDTYFNGIKVNCHMRHEPIRVDHKSQNNSNHKRHNNNSGLKNAGNGNNNNNMHFKSKRAKKSGQYSRVKNIKAADYNQSDSVNNRQDNGYNGFNSFISQVTQPQFNGENNFLDSKVVWPRQVYSMLPDPRMLWSNQAYQMMCHQRQMSAQMMPFPISY